MLFDKPPWRNWLARSAVNRKVGGSSPPGGGYFSCYSSTTCYFSLLITNFSLVFLAVFFRQKVVSRND